MASTQYTTTENNGIFVVRLNAYFSDSLGRDLKAYCLEKVGPDHKGLIFNFADSQVMNSAGLSFFFDLVSQITDQYSFNTAVCGLSKLVKSLFVVTNLFILVKEYPNEEAALASFK